MAWPTIDPTFPVGSQKGKVLDDYQREAKRQTIEALQEVSNYTGGGTQPALKTAVWTTAGRPSGAELVDRVTGYNSDLACVEYYDLATTTWISVSPMVLNQWTTETRPATPFTGQYGHCADLDVMERWSGEAWERVNSPARGDICMWSGSVADIETKKIGWVLADGSSKTIDGATFTVPDLRSRFIVGAGADGGTYTPGHDAVEGTGNYAPGAKGGEDKHTQTVAEMPSHRHQETNAPSGGGEVSIQGVNGSGTRTTVLYTLYTGGGQAMENRPPYYALCLLYKL